MPLLYLCIVNLRNEICAPTRKNLRVHGGAELTFVLFCRDSAEKKMFFSLHSLLQNLNFLLFCHDSAEKNLFFSAFAAPKFGGVGNN